MHTIVVPIDFEHQTRETLEVARRFAAADDGEVHLVHVVENPHMFIRRLDDEVVGRPAPQQVDEYTRRLAACAQVPLQSVTWRTAVLADDVAESLADYAAAVHADIIVVGQSARRTRRVLERLVHLAPCSVLAVDE